MVRRSAFAVFLVAGCVLALAVPAIATVGGPGPQGDFYSARSLCAPPADTVAPVVTKVTFARPTIDLDTGSRVETVTATASDAAGSGSPSGVDTLTIRVDGDRYDKVVQLTRSSGTPASGDWTGHFTVSPYAGAGTYSISEIDAVDADGNPQEYVTNTAGGPNMIWRHPSDDPTFTVTGTSATPPARETPGTLSSFAFSPTHVDTTAAARRVQFTARFAGASPHHVTVGLSAAHSTFSPPTGALTHTSHGWTGSVRIPRWLGDETLQPSLSASWGPAFMPMSRHISPTDLADRGFPARLTVVSGVDSKRPALTSLTFTPDPVDTTSGPQHLSITAHATDVGSGVHIVRVTLGIRHGVNGVAGGTYPHASQGFGYLAANAYRVLLHKTSSGAWVGGVKVRQCVPSGSYNATANVFDARDNNHVYPTRALSNAGLQSTVQVSSARGDVAAPFVWSATPDGSAKTITLDFSEGVTNVSTSTLAVYALDPHNGHFQTAQNITAITCADGSGTTSCSGPNATITTATLSVPSLTSGVRYDVFANGGQVTPQLVDGNGNPMNWNDYATQVRTS